MGLTGSAASGVLFGEVVEPGTDSIHTYLITNKHVIQGLGTAYVRMNTHAGGPAQVGELVLQGPDGSPYWFPHPDPEVDIAVTPVVWERLQEQGVEAHFFNSERETYTRDQLRDQHFSEGDPIYVLGFPMGLVGDERNRVVVRGGWIARIQDTLEGTNKTLLVDASVFPGNSGGAVVNRPEVASVGDLAPVADSRLIGIVSRYLTYRDEAVSAQSRRTRVVFEENSGLVAVYPIDYVFDCIANIPDAPTEVQATTVEAVQPPDADDSPA